MPTLPKVDLAPPLTETQLGRLIYSKWDFQQALSALTFLMEDFDHERSYNNVQLRRFRCYETSVILSFSRPFEISRGRTSLGLKAIGVHLDEEELALKAKLLALRRQVIAHSDEEYMHYRGAMLKPFEDLEFALPFFQFDEALHLREHHFRPIEALLHKLMHAISAKLFAIARETPARVDVYKTPRLTQS
jgi:hypothetical protein